MSILDMSFVQVISQPVTEILRIETGSLTLPVTTCYCTCKLCANPIASGDGECTKQSEFFAQKFQSGRGALNALFSTSHGVATAWG